MTTGTTTRRPFGGLSPGARRRALWVLGFAQLSLGVPLLLAERAMKRTGGPGIIPFELAGTPEHAERITRTWGTVGQAAARRSLMLDYPYLLVYATLQAIACNAASDAMGRRRREMLAAAGPPLAWGQLIAGGFDAIENTALLAILAGRDGRLPAVARMCATAKFALVTAGAGYVMLGLASNVQRR